MAEKNIKLVMVGDRIGFLFGYLFFSSVLFWLLSYFDKLPSSWSYVSILWITFAITIAGLMLKRFLS